jgi:hypothetical protein
MMLAPPLGFCPLTDSNLLLIWIYDTPLPPTPDMLDGAEDNLTSVPELLKEKKKNSDTYVY